MNLFFVFVILRTSSALQGGIPRNERSTYNTTLISYTTKLLNTILLNQDKKFRPTNPDSSPLNVEIDISVRSMGPISEQDMEFSLDCYFRQKWLDRRLAFTPINPDKPVMPLASKMLKDIWVPDTYIRNGRKSYLHTLTVPNILFRVRSDGQVHVSQRLTIKTKCLMFLKKFPMDVQACPIEIGSLGYFSNDVVYYWKDVELDAKMGNMLSQYKILGLFKSEHNFSDHREIGRNISVLKVYFKLQRQQGYYVLQIYTPCTLLVVMSWVSFWINKEASPARVALGIMTVLSMSTLGFGLRTDLPKVSHSTALDIYILSCFGFVFAAMVEYAVINYAQIVYIRKQVHDLKGLESNRAMEKMRLFTAGLMGARRETIQVDDLVLDEEEDLPWYSCFFRKKTKKQSSMFYRMAVKAAKARRKLKMKDPAKVVNRVDDVSKVIFPSLYVLFNILYWVAFLYWIPDEVDQIQGITDIKP
uniref:GABA A/glycine receptor subunit n=1 Tax=Haemonchus contortus TaxID=6289 RepID=A0A7I4YBA0_HAECO